MSFFPLLPLLRSSLIIFRRVSVLPPQGYLQSAPVFSASRDLREDFYHPVTKPPSRAGEISGVHQSEPKNCRPAR